MEAFQTTFRSISDTLLPAVVEVDVTEKKTYTDPFQGFASPFEFFFGRPDRPDSENDKKDKRDDGKREYEQKGLGSGVIVRRTGDTLYVLHEIGLIVVDYLQLMSGSSKRSMDNRVQEISEISRGLKLIARELNVPVIALSQLSRTVETRSPQIPMLSDLRESGSIEQDADIVMFLYREDYYNPDTERQNITDLIVAKHRRGATDKIELYFDKARVRFMSLDNKHE